MKLFDLSDEVVVVIGATGVLGGALAEGLAEAGAKVAVLGRNEERGRKRAAAIETKGGKAEFFVAETKQQEGLHAAHEGGSTSRGAPTGVVIAAGGQSS